MSELPKSFVKMQRQNVGDDISQINHQLEVSKLLTGPGIKDGDWIMCERRAGLMQGPGQGGMSAVGAVGGSGLRH